MARPASNTVTVKLTADTVEVLDNIGLNFQAAAEEVGGLRPPAYTHEQIIRALAEDAQRRQEAAWDVRHTFAASTAGEGEG